MAGKLLATVMSLLSAVTAAGADAQSSAPTTHPSGGDAVVIVLEGEINNYTQRMLERRLDDARSRSKTIILKINTWGGSALSAIEISQLLKQQNDLHITAYVDQKAISAGAMIAIACDEIVMQSGSMLGDCAPIVPGQQLEKTERAKSEGPILAEFSDSAEKNGYDPLLVQSMVSVGRVVHYIQSPTGERKFVDAAEYDQRVKNADWKPVEGVSNPVDDGESLLTITAAQAAALGLSKGTFNSLGDFTHSRSLRVIATLDHSPGEMLVGFLSSDAVRGLLSLMFLLSIYAAFHSPGHGAPEAIALTSLALLVGVPLMTGYASWFEIILMVLGIGLLATELFVIPGFGLIGITGIVLLLAGLTMTFVPTEPKLPGWLPSLPATYAGLWRGLVVVTCALGGSLIIGVWLNRHLPDMPYFGKLVLNTTVGSTSESSYAADIDEAVWPELGAVGRALTDLRPGGTAAFADPVSQEVQTAHVVSDCGFVLANTQIVVQQVHGNHVVVRPAETA